MKVPLEFELDAGNGWRPEGSICDRHVIAVPAEGLEAEGVNLGSTEAERSRDIHALYRETLTLGHGDADMVAVLKAIGARSETQG